MAQQALQMDRLPVRYCDTAVFQWLRTEAPCRWLGLIECRFEDLPFAQLQRAESHADLEIVRYWVNRLQTRRSVPPLVASLTEHNTYYLHDGNHRHDAFIQLFGSEVLNARIRTAVLFPMVGFKFRYQWFGTYGTYILEPASRASQIEHARAGSCKEAGGNISLVLENNTCIAKRRRSRRIDQIDHHSAPPTDRM